jgi:hypothetical protein
MHKNPQKTSLYEASILPKLNTYGNKYLNQFSALAYLSIQFLIHAQFSSELRSSSAIFFRKRLRLFSLICSMPNSALISSSALA